jgi:transcriptional regulator with XRE-family HTH domain
MPTARPPAASARTFDAEATRRLRDDLGLSQRELAAALHVSLELVQAWEGGRRIPRGAALRLLQLLRVAPELLETVASLERRQRPRREAGRPSGPSRNGVRTTVAPKDRAAGSGPIATLQPAPTAPALARHRVGREAESLLETLAARGIAFVAVGGVAARLRGAPGATDDLDIVYDRSSPNLLRLAHLLRDLKSTLRGAPGTIPFAADPRTLAHTATLALETRHGPLDLRQRIAGVGDFPSCLASATPVPLASGKQVPALTLDALIRAKRATGRSRDRDELPALEALLG